MCAENIIHVGTTKSLVYGQSGFARSWPRTPHTLRWPVTSTSEPFRTVVADPPWAFSDHLPGPKRGAAKHYRTLTIEEIVRFPLPPLAEDCRLFLWRVAAMQVEALRVMEAWGFTLKSEITWVKLTPKGDKLHTGMGRQVRMAHELCLIGVRGRPERLSASVPSVVFAPVGRHSEKPDAFFELVERLSPGPRLELFARKERPGWTCEGEEKN